MRAIFALGALLLVVLAPAVITVRANPPSPALTTPPYIEALVKQLGASKYVERENAQRELEAIGAPALDLLRKAIPSADQETSRRAGALVQKIETVVLAAKLLAPKRVNLAFKNESVLAAVAELQRQSGYKIHVAGNRGPLDKRRVTLTTGEVSFWQAFDALCLKAHLVEVNPGDAGVPTPVQRPIRIPPPPVLPQGAAAAAVGAKVEVHAGGVTAQVGQVPPPGDPIPGFPSFPTDAQLLVKDGNPKPMPTCYAGAFRIRALPRTAPPRARGAGEAVIYLELSAEPRLKRLTIDSSPSIRKACDDQGQTLAVVSRADPTVINRQMGGDGGVGKIVVTVPLKLGEKKAMDLRQLLGAFSAKILASPEPLVVVENILKAAGQTVKGKDGGSLQVLAIDKMPNGDLQMQVRMTNLAAESPLANVRRGGQVQWQQIQVQGQVQIQVIGPGGRARLMTTSSYRGRLPTLEDGKGQTVQLVQVPRRRVQAANGNVLEEVTLIFRPQPGQGDPARLVLSGDRLVTLPVAFKLVDVPLQ